MGKKTRIPIRPSLSREMIVHPDLDAVRASHVQSYEEQRRRLGKATERLRHYFDVDQPAFTRWWQERFSQELLLHMQLEDDHLKLQRLLFEVNQYKLVMQCNYAFAYAALTASLADGTREQLMQEVYEKLRQAEAEAEAKAKAAKKEEQDKERPTRRRIQEPKGRAAEATKEASPQNPEASSLVDQTESYIRKIYRDIVRLLHPDANGGREPSEEEKVLWTELQNAYQWRDLERIEQIYTTVKGQAARTLNFAKLPIGDIIAMKESLQEKLQVLTKELRGYKREANWNFEKRRKEPGFLRQLAGAIEIELREETYALREEITRLQKQFKAWAKPSRSRNSSQANA